MGRSCAINYQVNLLKNQGWLPTTEGALAKLDADGVKYEVRKEQLAWPLWFRVVDEQQEA